MVQAWQAQPDAPALDCANKRMSDPPRFARKPLTVSVPSAPQICSFVKIVSRPGTTPTAPWQFGVNVSGVPPVTGVKLTFAKVVPPRPQHTQVEIRDAERVPRPPSDNGPTPATNELALHEPLSALPQATAIRGVAGMRQLFAQAEPLALVAWPRGMAEPGSSPTAVAVAAQLGQLQAGDAAPAELTVMMDGATHAAPPTIALFFRKSRLLCSMDRPLVLLCHDSDTT